MKRSSKHTLKFANSGKLYSLKDFIAEYRIAVQHSIDFIWDNKFSYNDKVFSVSEDMLNLPTYLNYKDANYTGKLSARAFCSAFEQAIDMVRAATQKRKQTLFIRQKLLTERKSISHLQKLLENNYKLVKPNAKNANAELSSKCIDFDTSSNHFDLFVRLKSTGFDHIKLPIKFTKPFNKRKNWKLLTGVSISEKRIILRQETNTPNIKTTGSIVGADPGAATVISLSNGGQTLSDCHGHTLAAIMHKLERKKKGSKSFKKTQQHRENYINWSINQLDFSGVKEIRLETNGFRGEKRSRFLSHYNHASVEKKMTSLAEESGVRLTLRPSVYKSQRCCQCGFVCKANRKGKSFECKQCYMTLDADINSAVNNSIDLPLVPQWVVSDKLNRNGFFWKETGLFDLLGQELKVPDPGKDKLL